LYQTLDLENFTTASQQHSSTFEIVDRIYDGGLVDVNAINSPRMFTIGDESAPIQLTQYWFHVLTISNAKILIYFLNKIYRSNFIQQQSETVMV